MNTSSQKHIIAGNWKMNKSIPESIDFMKELNRRLLPLSPKNDLNDINHDVNHNVEVVIFPPFTSLFAIQGLSDRIKIGAQNMHFEEKGAFTGEISPVMLENIVEYVLIGHSERREIFKETDTDIGKKLKSALGHGFTPILCIGETLAEREAGQTFTKVETQLTRDLDGLSPSELSRLVIAYEPIWAIGTGRNATPEQAQEVHAFINKTIDKIINKMLEEKISSGITVSRETPLILYGGSVTPQNAQHLLAQKNINGLLIGGSSLKINDFFDIILLSCKQQLAANG
ncbi:MAG: triose-phosphate isomerase [Candidatus Omnitrophota bacterium]